MFGWFLGEIFGQENPNLHDPYIYSTTVYIYIYIVLLYYMIIIWICNTLKWRRVRWGFDCNGAWQTLSRLLPRRLEGQYSYKFKMTHNIQWWYYWMTILLINHHAYSWSLVQSWLPEVELTWQNVVFSCELLWYLTLSKSLKNMVSLSRMPEIVN